VPEWVDRLVAVNRPGPSKMVVAHLHPGEVSTSFQQSLMGSMAYDRARHRRMFSHDGRLGMIASQSGAGQLDRARNDCVRIFLDEHRDAELLVFVDSDMGWDPEAFERLAATMDDTNIDILGGLCFGQKITGPFAQRAVNTEWFPTLYRWVEDQQAFDTAHEYKPDALVEVAATGAAFVMISRRCLEAIRAAEGDHWFDMIANGDRRFGEDLSFCLRARRNGFKVHVDTGVKASHRKEVWFTEADYRMLRRPSSSAVTVVIPVKDNLHLTRSLVSQLRVQGGYTEILLFDNGSTDPEMIEWLAAQDVAEVFDASDCPGGISQMWNAGIGEAISRHRGLADVVFLNNDIKVGPLFLQCLVAGLRSSSAQAVSANYDNRPGSGVLPVRGICANRYDGTGGLAGFAFALRAEWLAGGFRFDEDMAWWFSDNDLLLEIERAGGWYGVVADAACEHVHGGSQTSTPDWWQERVAADRAAFEAKWPDVTLVPAA
jgi:GT2 family glycosyltransferase